MTAPVPHGVEVGDAQPAKGGRLRRSWPRVPAPARVLIAIAAVGAIWTSWDLVTADPPELTGDRFERIDEYVAHEVDGARIPGAAVAIVEGGTVVHARGFGDDGRGNPVIADTPFWIGSNTKSITALAVMQLVEAGEVELDRPVRDYLPDFGVADEAASERITVRHLLNQTSGISRTDGLRAVVDAEEDDSIADVVASLGELELDRPPGERFEYSNLNSVVLGAVIEAVTDQTWVDYVRINVFEPLRMTHTYADRDAADANGLTATHRTVFGFPVETDAAHQPGLAPSGYVYSSARDMARYLAMYVAGGTSDGRRVLSREGVAEMLTAATDERTVPLQGQRFTASYGAGWFIGRFGVAEDARWHQGSLPHFTTWMVLLPDTDRAVVVMLNAGNQLEIAGANAAWSRIPQGVVNLLLGDEPPAGPRPARRYILIDTLVVMAVVAQAWTLALVVGRSRPARSVLRRAAPLAWELLAAPLLLLAYPALTGGLGWGAAFTFVPDLSTAVVTIAGLAVITGLSRVVRLIWPARAT